MLIDIFISELICAGVERVESFFLGDCDIEIVIFLSERFSVIN